MTYKVCFHHPVTKEVIDVKSYGTLTEISSDLGISRHVLYRYMNNKLSDRYKSSCLLYNVTLKEEVSDDEEVVIEAHDEVAQDDVEVVIEAHEEVAHEEVAQDDVEVVIEAQEVAQDEIAHEPIVFESKEDILKRYRDEYIAKQARVSCECGGKYTVKSKASHEKTIRHKKHMSKK